MIAAKYSEPVKAARNLETLLAATIESSLLDVEGLGDDSGSRRTATWTDRRALARAAYPLVHETPGFVEYFTRRRRCRRSVPSISGRGRHRVSRPRRSRTYGPYRGC